MNGYGVLRWPDGKVYEGQFENDLKHGQGKLTTPIGDVFQGEWVMDEFKNIDKNLDLKVLYEAE